MIGSGLYWLLSAQLISSFTVLLPGLFESISSGNVLITSTGIISMSAGLWILDSDTSEFKRLASTTAGWIFFVPMMFAALDVYSTLISLSINRGTVELNPFVAAAIQYGQSAIIPFLVSYFALSQGLTLLMLRIGQWLFTESSRLRFLPFALVCSASAFGAISNLIGTVIGYNGGLVYLLAAIASALLCVVVFSVSSKFDRVKDDSSQVRLFAKLQKVSV